MTAEPNAEYVHLQAFKGDGEPLREGLVISHHWTQSLAGNGKAGGSGSGGPSTDRFSHY